MVFCYIYFANRVQKYYFLRTYASNKEKNIVFSQNTSIFTHDTTRKDKK